MCTVSVQGPWRSQFAGVSLSVLLVRVSPAGWDPITLVSLAFPAEYKFVYFLNLLGIGFPLEENCYRIIMGISMVVVKLLSFI